MWKIAAVTVVLLASGLAGLRAMTNAFGPSGCADFPGWDGAPVPTPLEGGANIEAGAWDAPWWDVRGPVVPGIDGSDGDMQPL